MSPSTSRSHISNPQIRWWSITSTTISWCTSTHRHIGSSPPSLSVTVLVSSSSLSSSSSSSSSSPSPSPPPLPLPPFPPFSLGGGLGGDCSSPCPLLFPLPLTFNVPHAHFPEDCPPELPVSLDGVLVVGLDGHWTPPPLLNWFHMGYLSLWWLSHKLFFCGNQGWGL